MAILHFGGNEKKTKKKRKISYQRKSKETQIEIDELNIDGEGKSEVSTTIGFLDHMLTLFAFHGLFDLAMKAEGDTHVDNHHLNEDIGISLGEAFKQALGECRGIRRTASAIVPMDMTKASVAVDLSNRAAFFMDIPEGAETKEDEGYSMELARDMLESFAKKFVMNLHVEIEGEGDLHHYLEATFKALGIALCKATRVDERRKGQVPSSKGIL